jgi:hypothetical protein
MNEARIATKHGEVILDAEAARRIQAADGTVVTTKDRRRGTIRAVVYFPCKVEKYRRAHRLARWILELKRGDSRRVITKNGPLDLRRESLEIVSHGEHSRRANTRHRLDWTDPLTGQLHDFTVSELAEFCGIPRSRVYARLRRGTEPVRIQGGQYA